MKNDRMEERLPTKEGFLSTGKITSKGNNINERKAKRRSVENSKIESNRNFVFINILDLIYPNLSISYELINRTGELGFKIPLSIGLVSDYDYKNSIIRNKVVSAGLGINLYYIRRSRIRCYIGPFFEFVVFKYGNYYGDDAIYSTDYEPITGYYYAIKINNGILFKILKNLYLSHELGLGMKNDITNYYNYYIYNRTKFIATPEINIILRF